MRKILMRQNGSKTSLARVTLRLGSSTIAISGKCDPQTLRDLLSVISSLVSVYGPMHCASQDGQMNDPSGPEAAPENANYAFGAADLCAASVGAPHWRQRFYWVADSAGPRYYRTFQGAEEQTRNETWLFVPGSSNSTRDVADADKTRLSLRKCQKLSGTQRNQKGRTTGQWGRAFGKLADADSNGRSARQQAVETVGYGNSTQSDGCDRRPDPVNSFWRDGGWLRCTEGKGRAVGALHDAS